MVVEKALAKKAQWDEMWEKRLERQRKVQMVSDKKALAAQKTAEAARDLAALEGILSRTLGVDDAVHWGALKDNSDYPDAAPAKPADPTLPVEPKRSNRRYTITVGILEKLFPSRLERQREAMESRYREDHNRWEETRDKMLAEFDAQIGEYEASMARWEQGRKAYLDARDRRNAEIDRRREEYLGGKPAAILEYCDVVLSNSDYPSCFPKSYELDYNPANLILIVDYQMPPAHCIPSVREVRYIQSRDEFTESQMSKAQINRLYDGMLYQIALRTIHELYEADIAVALDLIVFNGYVKSVDSATGHEVNACVLSVQANKDEFTHINLRDVEPRACFKKLKGVGSGKLHSLTPIAPILRIEREDRRFVDAYAVADAIQEGDNLAAMDWEDFEHLVRELFEKEFCGAGAEVKVTRASRDGGIDAVVFDPDPLRGGKIVIQAKRYTNVVGVSAVRDLYGTLVNEGANKGILVTTADYGPDAYEFAKGKPIVLLNGSNLLHLLEKHGHKARIDLREAKLILDERVN
jgi:restriction system protein